MTAQGLISDGQAREIATRMADAATMGQFGPLARSGAITRQLVAWAGVVDGRWPDHAQRLAAYVSHHGERGPVEGWGER